MTQKSFFMTEKESLRYGVIQNLINNKINGENLLLK